MKFYILLALACILSACNGQQTNAKRLQKQLQTTMKENIPGTLSTTENGWTMHAKIDGKLWVADAMMPAKLTGRIIGYYGKDYISFPYDVRDMVVGKVLKLSERWAVDFVNEDNGICGGTKGVINVTKVGDGWAEGTFSFIINHCLDKPAVNIAVTDGFFRIRLVDDHE